MQSSGVNFDFFTVVFSLIHGFKVVIVGMQKCCGILAPLTGSLECANVFFLIFLHFILYLISARY